MIYTIPTKLYEYDVINDKFIPKIVNLDYDIQEDWKELYFRDKPSGYTISNTGKVKKPDGSDAPLYYDKDGYTRFCLYIPKNNSVYKNKHKIAYPYKTHRAVAELFVKNNDPNEYNIVMHRNDIPDCNFAINLQWGTAYMNMKDKTMSGRAYYLSGEEKPDSIFTEKDVRKICNCIYHDGIRKTEHILQRCNISNRSKAYINSFRNLIQNVKRKHCWKYIIDEYENGKT